MRLLQETEVQRYTSHWASLDSCSSSSSSVFKRYI